MMRRPRKGFGLVLPLALAWVLSGCTDDPEDVPAVSMSKDQVWQEINDNLAAVDSEFVPVENTPDNANLVSRYGCATSSDSLMPEGPPWRYQIWQGVQEIGDYERFRDGMQRLADAGFDVAAPPRARDPRDLSAEDDRGFSVDLVVNDAPPGQEPTVSLMSNSPCVRHPDPDDDR